MIILTRPQNDRPRSFPSTLELSAVKGQHEALIPLNADSYTKPPHQDQPSKCSIYTSSHNNPPKAMWFPIYISLPLVWLQPPLTPHKCPGNDPLLEEEHVSLRSCLNGGVCHLCVDYTNLSSISGSQPVLTHLFCSLDHCTDAESSMILYRLHGKSQQYAAINSQAGNSITDSYHIRQKHTW